MSNHRIPIICDQCRTCQEAKAEAKKHTCVNGKCAHVMLAAEFDTLYDWAAIEDEIKPKPTAPAKHEKGYQYTIFDYLNLVPL